MKKTILVQLFILLICSSSVLTAEEDYNPPRETVSPVIRTNSNALNNRNTHQTDSNGRADNDINDNREIIWNNLYWGMNINNAKKQFKKSVLKEKTIDNKKVIIVSFNRNDKFKSGVLYFNDSKLFDIKLVYKKRFTSFQRVNKEIFSITKNFGNYTEIKSSKKKSFKWTNSKTQVYYSLNFSTKNKIKRITLSYTMNNETNPSVSINSNQNNVLNLKTEIWYKPDNTLSHKIIHEYNDKNKPVKLIQYNAFNQIEIYTDYHYNNAGDLIGEKSYTFNNSPVSEINYNVINGIIEKAIFKEYYGNNYIIKTILYTRNEKGNIVSEKWINEKDKAFYITYYSYNNYDQVTSIEHFATVEAENKLIKTLFKTQKFIYNTDKKLEIIETYNDKNEKIEFIRYFYNDKKILQYTQHFKPFNKVNERVRGFISTEKPILRVDYNYE